MAEAKAAVSEAEVDAEEGGEVKAKASFLAKIKGLIGKVLGLNKFVLIGGCALILVLAGGGYYMLGGHTEADGAKSMPISPSRPQAPQPGLATYMAGDVPTLISVFFQILS